MSEQPESNGDCQCAGLAELARRLDRIEALLAVIERCHGPKSRLRNLVGC
jgi:hypothetical protein